MLKIQEKSAINRVFAEGVLKWNLKWRTAENSWNNEFNWKWVLRLLFLVILRVEGSGAVYFWHFEASQDFLLKIVVKLLIRKCENIAAENFKWLPDVSDLLSEKWRGEKASTSKRIPIGLKPSQTCDKFYTFLPPLIDGSPYKCSKTLTPFSQLLKKLLNFSSPTLTLQ